MWGFGWGVQLHNVFIGAATLLEGNNRILYKGPHQLQTQTAWDQTWPATRYLA